MHPMNIIPISACIVVDAEDNVLLLRRKKAPYKGYWAFPGGKQELGETFEDAAIREIFEETGLTILSPKLIAILNERLHRDEEFISQFLLNYSVANVNGQANETLSYSDEGDLQWFPLYKLPEDIIASDGKILDMYLRNRRSQKIHIIEGILECENMVDEEKNCNYSLGLWNVLNSAKSLI